MRRLPQDAMMDVLLAQNKVTPEMVGEVAAILADFHQKAATGEEINRLGGIDAVIQNTSENFAQTEKYFGIIILPETYQRIKDYTEDFIKDEYRLVSQAHGRRPHTGLPRRPPRRPHLLL